MVKITGKKYLKLNVQKLTEYITISKLSKNRFSFLEKVLFLKVRGEKPPFSKELTLHIVMENYCV
jgi:hypothetical protein